MAGAIGADSWKKRTFGGYSRHESTPRCALIGCDAWRLDRLQNVWQTRQPIPTNSISVVRSRFVGNLMQFNHLGRREFITILGGAAAWPLAVRAQQPEKLAIIGFLGATTASAQAQWTAAFVQRLGEL